MKKETLKMMRHIFDARIDNAADASAYEAWTSARDIVEYALADNFDCLKEFDYLSTWEELEEKFEKFKRANDQPSNFFSRRITSN